MNKLIQSYVEDKWFVSTIYRQSSAALAPDLWYYETMVWPWDDGKRENFTEQHDSGLSKEAALENHAKICRRLAMPAETPVTRVEAHQSVYGEHPFGEPFRR